RFPDDGRIELFVFAHDVPKTKMAPNSLPRRCAELVAYVSVQFQDRAPPLGQGVWIARWDHDSCVADYRSTIPDISDDTRNSARHRFPHNIWKTLGVRGQRSNVQGGGQHRDVTTLAKHVQTTSKTLVSHKIVEHWIARDDAFTHQDKVRRRIAPREN